MKVSDKWFVTSNDGKTAVLRRETNEEVSESEVQRPDNVSAGEWKTRWPVGMEIGADEYHDRIRFESLRRHDGDLTASEAWAVERWNRPDGPIKQVEDVTESCRVFLKNFGTEDMVGFARLLYLKFSTRPGIAAEYAAISSNITLMNFIEKYESVDDLPLDTASLEELLKRMEREGFWKGEQ